MLRDSDGLADVVSEVKRTAAPYERSVPAPARRDRPGQDDPTARFSAALVDALPRLRRYAIAMVGDVATADDILQDCIERAWKSRDSLRAGPQIFAWLRTILHNAHIDWIRRSRPRAPVVALDELSEELAAGPSLDAATPALDVARAMNSLSAEHRQVLLLVGLEGLSYREVADELGVPIGTVMSRLARARDRLRQALESGPPRSQTSIGGSRG
jgi:RNA polymerase sigma-70 factor (ECF subfamily)